MQVIALYSESKQVGKTTTAQALMELLTSKGYKVLRISFADALRAECLTIVGGDRGEQYRELLEALMHSNGKDTPMACLANDEIPSSGYRTFLRTKFPNSRDARMSLRDHLVQYGTYYCRKHLDNEHVWIRKVMDTILESVFTQGTDYVIIDDLRTVEEAKALGILRDTLYVEVTGCSIGVPDTSSYSTEIREYLLDNHHTLWNYLSTKGVDNSIALAALTKEVTS